MKNQYSSFFYNFTIYSVAMVIASALPFLVRTLISFFIKTPAISELKADASYLFDIIYPIMGVITISAFLFGGYFACYIAGYNIAYKARGCHSERKAKIQIVACGIFILLWNLFFSYGSNFSGIFGAPFWYPAAILGSMFGLFDKTNLLSSLSESDLYLNNFVIMGILPLIIWLVLLFTIILTAVFVYLSYKGRLKGEADGLVAVNKYIEEIKHSDSSQR